MDGEAVIGLDKTLFQQSPVLLLHGNHFRIFNLIPCMLIIHIIVSGFLRSTLYLNETKLYKIRHCFTSTITISNYLIILIGEWDKDFQIILLFGSNGYQFRQ
jgi:hypothetical protein